MKKLIALALLLMLLTGCTGPAPAETTVPTTAPTTVPPTTQMPTTAPEETENAVLQKGFYTLIGARTSDYVYEEADVPGFQSYLFLDSEGTGTLIFDDLNGDVTIDVENIYFGDLVIPYMYYSAEMSPDGQAMLMIMLTDRATSVIFRLAPAE